MSCAVMFQPCLSTEGISITNAKAEHTSHMHSSIPPHHLHNNINHTPPHEALYTHTHTPSQQLPDNINEQRVQHPSRVSCRRASPNEIRSSSQDSPTSERAFKKLCTNSREASSISSTNAFVSSTLHQSPQTQIPSAVTPIRTASPQLTESDIKYVSANCVVVTHYRGNASAVVDEHFSRALAAKTTGGNDSPAKVSSPMTTRSFPPSFYQPHFVSRHSLNIGSSLSSHAPSELYDAYHGGLHSIQTPCADPWAYSLSSQAYAHRGVGHDVYHPAMTSAASPYQYASLGFQQPFSRLSSVPVPSQMNKAEGWGSRYYDSFVTAGASELANGLDSTYSSSHYHNMAGLETGMSQECPKDLYWL